MSLYTKRFYLKYRVMCIEGATLALALLAIIVASGVM